MDSPANPISVDNMAFSANADITDARLDFKSTVTLAKLVNPAVGEMSFAVDFALNRLDAASMQKITQAMRVAQAAPDSERAMADLMPQLQGEVEKLVAAGAELRINRLELNVPQGDLNMDLTIDIAAAEDPAGFRWSSALLSTKADANIRISASLFDMAAAMNPDLNSILAMGFLQRDGDDYVLVAEYEKGLLNINGAPMPVPMPGM